MIWDALEFVHYEHGRAFVDPREIASMIEETYKALPDKFHVRFILRSGQNVCVLDPERTVVKRVQEWTPCPAP